MNQKKVLLLGDSIRMSYQPVVKAMLKDKADVVGPEENCAFTAYTLENLPKWLATFGTPDVVHWNNGLHDCGHNPNRAPVQIPLETYLANLETLLQKLRATRARIIWATSTPVHAKRPFLSTDWSWRIEDIVRYNAAATAFMKSKGIPVNDLFAIVKPRMDEYIVADGVHLAPAGIQACATAVAKEIEHALRI